MIEILLNQSGTEGIIVFRIAIKIYIHKPRLLPIKKAS